MHNRVNVQINILGRTLVMLQFLFRGLSHIPAFFHRKSIAMVGPRAGWIRGDYNATMWPQLIIWDDDPIIWDGQLGLSVAKMFLNHTVILKKASAPTQLNLDLTSTKLPLNPSLNSISVSTQHHLKLIIYLNLNLNLN